MLNIKILTGVILFFSFSCNSYSQGFNNDFDYDQEDINIIAKELGIQAFKFPIKQNENEIVDIIIEEYENKKLVRRISIIDESIEGFKKYNIDGIKFFIPDNENLDSPYLHRFYFIERDSILDLKIKSHGIEKIIKFNFENKAMFSVRAINSISEEIDSLGYLKINTDLPKRLMFLYANSKEDKKTILNCPSGLSKENILEMYHYVIFIDVKKYQDKK